MSNDTHQTRTFRANLTQLARAAKNLIPPTELEHYRHYTSFLGRGDLVAASKLGKMRTNPQLWVGTDPLMYRNICQAYSLCSKITVSGDSRSEDTGWLKFLASEDKCRYVNRKLRCYSNRPLTFARRAPSYSALILRVQRRVMHYLGALTLKRYESIVSRLCFGPGMTLSSVDSSRVTAPFKLSDMATCTAEARGVWSDIASHFNVPDFWSPITDSSGNLRVQLRVREVPGCRFTFVPKSADEKRTIAIEPSGNMAGQLAIHHHLLPRLASLGLNLHDQSKNRRLALEGSRNGSFATIDLSSASDSVSYELVKLLVPREWFLLFDALRSPVGSFRESTFVLEKFSSMGNGFTFVLESIIFRSIVDAVMVDDTVPSAVYGDDIIVPSSYFNSTVRALRFFGFSINTKKSFSEGPFRESCGLDAFDGVDVRPVFPRSLDMSVMELISLHNQLFANYPSLSKVVASWLPLDLHLYGPPCPGKCYLFTEDVDLLREARVWRDDWQCFVYRAYAQKARLCRFPVRYRLLASLFNNGLYSRGVPRRFFTKLVKCTTPAY